MSSDRSRVAESLKVFLKSLGSVDFLPRRRFTSTKWRCEKCGLATNDGKRIAAHIQRNRGPLYTAHMFVLRMGDTYAYLSRGAIAFKDGSDVVAFPLTEFEKASSLFGAAFPALAATALVEG